MDYPCPQCDAVFRGSDLLINHVLNYHSAQSLTGVLQAMRQLTQTDFTQVDSHWIYTIGDEFQLSIERDEQGHFKLVIHSSIGPIPAATQYPTEPEWDRALLLANKFMSAYAAALETDKNNE